MMEIVGGNEWFFTGKGGERHRVVCVQLARWFKGEYPEASVCCQLKSYHRGYQLFSLSPDIDVAVARDSTLVGCEVKLFAGRHPGLTETLLAGKAGRVVKRIDQEVYNGLGQTLFLLRYVHQAYLVLPDLDYLVGKKDPYGLAELRYFLKELIDRYLPLGLIGFLPKAKGDGFEFRLVCKAEQLASPLGFHIGYIIDAVKEHSL